MPTRTRRVGPSRLIAIVAIVGLLSGSQAALASPQLAEGQVAIPDSFELPGHIEAEDYTPGGEGSGFHDTTIGNAGGRYRYDNVDIQACDDDASDDPCYNVGWIRRGEWLAYAVTVTADDTFTFSIRVATPNNGQALRLELDGNDVTGQVAIPNTGDWQAWTTIPLPAVAIAAGDHELRLVADTNGFNVNFMDVAAGSEPPPPSDAVTVAAAGDIACDPRSGYFNNGLGDATRCRQAATADVLVNGGVDAVLTLGDNQYGAGSLDNFLASYDPSWGRVKDITYPAIGNHEYSSGSAAAYFTYFGAVAGDPSKGYYSFNIGAWHIIVLNSNCSKVGGCDTGDPQEQWLKQDLADNQSRCTLAYWHHPRFSSGEHGNTTWVDDLWNDLYDAGVDVALASHDHDYERFAPLDKNGQRDDANGIREFVVGTGGASHYGFDDVQPNSQVRNDDTFGVLSLTLSDGGYAWNFLPIAGQSFTDSGSGSCH